MDRIMDQRHIYGGKTVADVEARWLDIVDRRNEGLAVRSLPPVILAPTGRSVTAYVNHGRWVARCECGGGMGAWDENPRCACMDCGRVYGVQWPEPDVRSQAEALLLARADELHRNWDPAIETVERLQSENTLLEGVL